MDFYLTKLPNNFIRIALTKLEQERGRGEKIYLIGYVYRVGSLKYHVVMRCNKYDNIRKKYLPRPLYQTEPKYV